VFSVACWDFGATFDSIRSPAAGAMGAGGRRVHEHQSLGAKLTSLYAELIGVQCPNVEGFV